MRCPVCSAETVTSILRRERLPVMQNVTYSTQALALASKAQTPNLLPFMARRVASAALSSGCSSRLRRTFSTASSFQASPPMCCASSSGARNAWPSLVSGAARAGASGAPY